MANANDRGEVSVDEGELVQITTSVGDDTSDYWVRCLPADFPPLNIDRPGEPATGWYLLSPSLDFRPPDPRALLSYAVILDAHGAPVWYQRVVEDLTQAGGFIVDFKRLPNGNLAWKTAKDPFGLNDSGYGEYDLDGQAVATWKTVGSPTDHHDLLQLPNGNMMMISYHHRTGVDVSGLGTFAEPSTVVDGWLQEVTPEGKVAWEWRSEDHLSFDEVPESIRSLEDGVSQTVMGPGGAQQVFVDPVHPNSVELDPETGDVIMSARSTNAVYKIRRNPGGADDGDVLWKLGRQRTGRERHVGPGTHR